MQSTHPLNDFLYASSHIPFKQSSFLHIFICIFRSKARTSTFLSIAPLSYNTPSHLYFIHLATIPSTWLTNVHQLPFIHNHFSRLCFLPSQHHNYTLVHSPSDPFICTFSEPSYLQSRIHFRFTRMYQIVFTQQTSYVYSLPSSVNFSSIFSNPLFTSFIAPSNHTLKIQWVMTLSFLTQL